MTGRAAVLRRPCIGGAAAPPYLERAMTKKKQEPYPGYNREKKARAAKAREMREAAAVPLPGPLADVFASLPREVGGRKIRPLVACDWQILTMLNVPFIEQFKDGKKPDFTVGDGILVAFLFTNPAEDCWDLLQNKGVARFKNAAMREIGMISPFEVKALVEGAALEVLRSVAAAIEYVPKESEGGTQHMDFPTPPAGTGSAGGSKKSAAS
jgi:hypothetical protein